MTINPKVAAVLVGSALALAGCASKPSSLFDKLSANSTDGERVLTETCETVEDKKKCVTSVTIRQGNTGPTVGSLTPHFAAPAQQVVTGSLAPVVVAPAQGVPVQGVPVQATPAQINGTPLVIVPQAWAAPRQ